MVACENGGAQVIRLQNGVSGGMIQPANLMTFASAPRLPIFSL